MVFIIYFKRHVSFTCIFRMINQKFLPPQNYAIHSYTYLAKGIFNITIFYSMWLPLCDCSIYSTPRLPVLLMHENIGAAGLVLVLVGELIGGVLWLVEGIIRVCSSDGIWLGCVGDITGFGGDIVCACKKQVLLCVAW